MLRRLALAGLLISATVGASPRASDTDRPDPESAYVAVHLDIQHEICGRSGYARAERIVLARVEPGGRLKRVGVADVPSRRPTLLRLPPGLYFLARLECFVNDWQENYHPRLFLFTAAAGELSFPGVWHFSGSWTGDLQGSVTVRNWTTATATDLEQVAQAFPKLAKVFPPKLTQVVAPDGQPPTPSPQPTGEPANEDRIDP